MQKYYNVLTLSFPKKHYLTHPLRFFKEVGWNIQSAYKRITKGYADVDWINFSEWFVNIVPQMLREMAMYGHGYPGTEPFETPEKWNSWLHRMADQLTYLQDENNGNEYTQAYLDQIMKNPNHSLFEDATPEEKEIKDKYLKRSLEVYEEHKQLFQETMKELLEYWECLWD